MSAAQEYVKTESNNFYSFTLRNSTGKLVLNAAPIFCQTKCGWFLLLIVSQETKEGNMALSIFQFETGGVRSSLYNLTFERLSF